MTVAPTSKYTWAVPACVIVNPSCTIVSSSAFPHTSTQMLQSIAAITPTEINVSIVVVP
ncbi:unannotated protein [freshwater metagenome]|uniref:Unannotated protein n=1 Tax=freshwater metagenome TaxID=449393 RepID=A0A6J6P106_9ZZZZ